MGFIRRTVAVSWSRCWARRGDSRSLRGPEEADWSERGGEPLGGQRGDETPSAQTAPAPSSSALALAKKTCPKDVVVTSQTGHMTSGVISGRMHR